MRDTFRLPIIGISLVLSLASAQAADGVDAIKQRGTLIVGSRPTTSRSASATRKATLWASSLIWPQMSPNG